MKNFKLLVQLGIIALILVLNFYPKKITYSKIDWNYLSEYQPRLIEYVDVYASKDDPFVIVSEKREFLKIMLNNSQLFHDAYQENTVEVFLKFKKVSIFSTSGYSRRYNNYQSTFFVDKSLVEALKAIQSLNVEDILENLNNQL